MKIREKRHCHDAGEGRLTHKHTHTPTNECLIRSFGGRARKTMASLDCGERKENKIMIKIVVQTSEMKKENICVEQEAARCDRAGMRRTNETENGKGQMWEMCANDFYRFEPISTIE